MSKDELPYLSHALRKRILREDPEAFERSRMPLRFIRWIVHEIIFGTDTHWGKKFDVILLWAILFSLAVVLAVSVTEIDERIGTVLTAIEWGFTVLFTIEYAVRVWSSPEPRKYIFSFFGIIDLLSVVPTYVGIFVTGPQFLVVLRTIRLLRAFRILKLARYMRGAEVLVNALIGAKEKVLVFLSAVITLVFMLGTLMHVIEGGQNGFDNIPKSIYWAVITLTTVGYGDIVPVTALGKFVASAIMILGYGIIAIPTGLVGVEMAKAEKVGPKLPCQRCGETEHLSEPRFCHRCGEKMESLSAKP
jgi:voltage-gated potassium channel